MDHLLALWPLAAAQLRDLHLAQSTLRPRSFQYFMADESCTEPVREPGDSQLRMMENAADIWFSKLHCGTGTRVHLTLRGCEWWFLVRHGERMRRFNAVATDGSQSVHCFRPETFDLIVYNANTEELRINAPSEGRRQFYRRTIGTYIFGRENHFPGTNKYNLQPLTDNGRDAMVCSDVARLFGAELTGLKFTYTDDSRSRVAGYSGEDIFGLFETGLCQFPRNAKLLQATFKLRIADSERPRSVTIKPPNVAQYVRDDDAHVVEQWLQGRGFSLTENLNNNGQSELHLGMD